jgi:hypothetical protein
MAHPIHPGVLHDQRSPVDPLPDLLERNPDSLELFPGDHTVGPIRNLGHLSLHRPVLLLHSNSNPGQRPNSPRVEAAALAVIVTTMPKRDARMVALGYGKFVRADRVFALVPLEGAERREGRRTYVHVDGLSEPIVASRSERAIMADVEQALAEAAGIPRRRRVTAGQESLL